MFMCFTLKKGFAQSELGFAHPVYNITVHSNLQNTIPQGAYPFNETNFQDFSRTRIDFSRALKFTLMLLHYLDLNVNSPYCLPYTSYLLQDNLVLSTGLTMGIGHSKEIQRLML